MAPVSKVKTIDELKRIRYSAGQLGLKFVFTNGCFDILHVGHLRSLNEAKKLGDILLVAVNSDESLKTLKKMERPITTEAERAELLAGLSCVDYVVIFDSLTAEDTILALKPDICAKGTDYTPETVPERNSILSYGGKIMITGDAKNHATRNIIADIKALAQK